MSYTLYTDKNENFECEVSVKNASLKGSIVRLIVESLEGPTLIFKGELNGDKCIIPIKRLKGLLDENEQGKIHLEVIVEDTYFRPWTDTFSVKEYTSVKVKINEQKQSSNKPIVKIKSPILNKRSNSRKNKGVNVLVPKNEIAMICEQFGIKKQNFKKRQKEFFQILREYFKANSEYNYYIRPILRGIDNFLR